MYFQRLRDLREDRDLRQQDIAELLHTSQTVYSRYERGFQTIPVSHLLTLADFYQTSTDYLLGLENTYELDLSGLTEEEIQALLNLIKAMKRRK